MGARLKPGVSLRQAQAELANIGRALEQEFPDANRGKGLRVVASSPIPGDVAPVAAFLAVLMGIVLLVLAIACANVAGVLLARATARRREIAVRLAIGAGRGRLIRQMLVESMLLFLIGGGAGLALARVMTDAAGVAAAVVAGPDRLDACRSTPRDRVHARPVAHRRGALGPRAGARRRRRRRSVGGLKADAQRWTERLRLRNAFVVAQVAFSIVLVVGAGLFVRALQRAAEIDPGFDPHGVELAALDLSLAGYTPDTGRVFARELIQRVRTLPGVQSATLAAIMPLGGGGLGLGGFAVPGVEPPKGRRFFDADWNVVTPGYFATMKMALASGRDFTDADREGHAVGRDRQRDGGAAVVAGAGCDRQDAAAGECPARRARTRMRTLIVVAVARDTKYRDLGEDPRPFVYVPIQQQYMPRTTIVARSTQGQRLAAELRTLLASMNPEPSRSCNRRRSRTILARRWCRSVSRHRSPAASASSACCSRRSGSTASPRTW